MPRRISCSIWRTTEFDSFSGVTLRNGMTDPGYWFGNMTDFANISMKKGPAEADPFPDLSAISGSGG
jgi:hypothetical protein